MTERLKRVVIKEELIALTGDFKTAVILNQMIYWSERISDFDRFLEEEITLSNQHGIDINIEKRSGWMYKSFKELSIETMLGLSESNISKHVKTLLDNQWLERRRNPKYAWDRKYQYRVNIVKIQRDLFSLGYHLEGYKADVSSFSILEDASSNLEDCLKTGKPNKLKTYEADVSSFSILEDASSVLENCSSVLEDRSNQNRRAIPDIVVVVVDKEQQSDLHKKMEPGKLIETVKLATNGTAISSNFAEEICNKYDQTTITQAVSDLKYQLMNGLIIKKGVGAWLRSYLNRGYEADKLPLVPNTNKKVPKKGKTQNKNTDSNKKKEFIKSLYV